VTRQQERDTHGINCSKSDRGFKGRKIRKLKKGKVRLEKKKEPRILKKKGGPRVELGGEKARNIKWKNTLR